MTIQSGQEHSPRILVVEDDAEMRALLRDELVDAGYEICQAGDGAEGALKLAEEPFDLIVTDLKMPRMSGKEMLAVARQRCPDVPVIAITAFGDAPEFVKSYHGGFFAYLRKPFRMEELKTAIRAALQTRRQQSAC